MNTGNERWDGLPPEQWKAAARERQQKAKTELAEARQRKARVLKVMSDGKYVQVSFLNDAGEHVIATYKLMGYDKAPAAVVQNSLERQQNATDPMTLVGKQHQS